MPGISERPVNALSDVVDVGAAVVAVALVLGAAVVTGGTYDVVGPDAWAPTWFRCCVWSVVEEEEDFSPAPQAATSAANAAKAAADRTV
ncbi:MAG: hypothetical protein AB7L13_07570 [Acidimicrobiia bacterium]